MNKFESFRGGKDMQPKMQMLQPGQQVKVDLKNAKPMVCDCGCKYFESVVLAYRVSALASPTGQELLVQQPVLRCANCKKLLEMKGSHDPGQD